MATSAHNSAVVAAALSLALIDASAISGGDILARVSSLVASSSRKSASSLLSIQTSDVPVEITKALELKSLQWETLSDEVRIGLLWSYGYVLRGGSTTRLVPVYTACSAETTAVVGINENRLGVTMDSIELTSAAFNSTSCAASACTDYLEATTTNCTPSISSPLQCAISTADVPESSAAFWTSASRVATTPYPQVYAHSVPVTSGSPVHIVSIHMATAAAAVGCASTADAVIPCLALDSATQSRKFCRPKVNDVQLNAFLDSISTNQDQAIEVSTRADGTGSSSSGLSTGAIIGIVGGALVVLGLVAFYFFRSSRKPPVLKDSPDERVFTELGAPKNPRGRPPTNPYGMPLQRNNTTMGPVIDSNRDNDTVDSTDRYISEGLDELEDSVRSLTRSGVFTRGRQSSVSAADKGPYGKSTADYMDESDVLREFFNDNHILSRRIPHDELTTLRILSKGSYGEVFLGQLETRHVAMKRLLPEKKHLTRSIEQFTAEIRLMTQLEHRNIVSFIGVCWDYVPNITVVVEYMDNGDLAEVLAKSKGKLTWPKEKISISMDIAEGLVYLHSMRPVIVHRDLKSKNVLLNKRGQAKLSDFGVSRKTAVNETMTSGVGTLLWTAPEIIEGRKYSEKADIFSLGVVLSEIDTGEEPYASVRGDASGERLPGMQLVQMVRLGEIKVAFRDDCPRKIRELAEKCTSLDPDRRPTSMEVAYTLKSIIAPTLRR